MYNFVSQSEAMFVNTQSNNFSNYLQDLFYNPDFRDFGSSKITVVLELDNKQIKKDSVLVCVCVRVCVCVCEAFLWYFFVVVLRRLNSKAHVIVLRFIF